MGSRETGQDEDFEISVDFKVLYQYTRKVLRVSEPGEVGDRRQTDEFIRRHIHNTNFY